MQFSSHLAHIWGTPAYVARKTRDHRPRSSQFQLCQLKSKCNLKGSTSLSSCAPAIGFRPLIETTTDLPLQGGGLRLRSGAEKKAWTAGRTSALTATHDQRVGLLMCAALCREEKCACGRDETLSRFPCQTTGSTTSASRREDTGGSLS